MNIEFFLTQWKNMHDDAWCALVMIVYINNGLSIFPFVHVMDCMGIKMELPYRTLFCHLSFREVFLHNNQWRLLQRLWREDLKPPLKTRYDHRLTRTCASS